jgi:hypothetical protein
MYDELDTSRENFVHTYLRHDDSMDDVLMTITRISHCI